MSNYDEMEYFALKAECKKQGLDSTGKKPELIERLMGTSQVQEIIAEDKEIKEKEAVLSTYDQEKVIEEFERQKAQEVENFKREQKFKALQEGDNKAKSAPFLTEDRLSMLESQIAQLAAGKGKFEFQINHFDGSYGVEFSGASQGKIFTTLLQNDASILKEARYYFNGRYRVGKNAQVDYA